MGVEVHAWPDETLDALRTAWEEIVAEEVAADPLLAEAWQRYVALREDYDA